MTTTAVVAERFRRFADVECRGYSDVYDRLATAAALDQDVLEFVASMPVTHPNLFFASIQLLTGPAGMPASGSELRAFLRERGGEVADAMRSRRTQTNEVGRCAVLLMALPPGPLALVEVGASAGLCLLLDRYRYELGSVAIGSAASPVRLRCAVEGPAPLPAEVPAIVWRRGLDIHPLDVRDEGAQRWLFACVWPDHAERRRRLERAIALARTEPPVVLAGDLVDDLPAVLAEAPADARLVVYHSAVLSYVTLERRRAFAAALADAAQRREIVWISNEAAGVLPEMTALAPPVEGRFLLGRTRFADGRRWDELLAVAHPHGAEVTWLRASA